MAQDDPMMKSNCYLGWGGARRGPCRREGRSPLPPAPPRPRGQDPSGTKSETELADFRFSLTVFENLSTNLVDSSFRHAGEIFRPVASSELRFPTPFSISLCKPLRFRFRFAPQKFNFCSGLRNCSEPLGPLGALEPFGAVGAEPSQAAPTGRTGPDRPQAAQTGPDRPQATQS